MKHMLFEMVQKSESHPNRILFLPKFASVHYPVFLLNLVVDSIGILKVTNFDVIFKPIEILLPVREREREGLHRQHACFNQRA